MPRLTIDYSPPLGDKVGMPRPRESLRRAAFKTQLFPTAEIPPWAFKAERCAVANAGPERCCACKSVRQRGGKDLHVPLKACAKIFEAAKTCLADVMTSGSITARLERRSIGSGIGPKTSAMRGHLRQGMDTLENNQDKPETASASSEAKRSLAESVEWTTGANQATRSKTPPLSMEAKACKAQGSRTGRIGWRQ